MPNPNHDDIHRHDFRRLNNDAASDNLYHVYNDDNPEHNEPYIDLHDQCSGDDCPYDIPDCSAHAIDPVYVFTVDELAARDRANYHRGWAAAADFVIGLNRAADRSGAY